SGRGAAVKARPREQHLVVQTVKFGRDLMTSRRIFLVERQIRKKPLFRNDVHDETHPARLLEQRLGARVTPGAPVGLLQILPGTHPGTDARPALVINGGDSTEGPIS